MSKPISYTQALDGILSKEDAEGVLGLLERHKNWGAQNARIPSHILVALVDAVKKLKEGAVGYYETK